MRNRARFIFPRLVGATFIVGLAALAVTILFKILLALVFISGTVLLVKRLLFDARHRPSRFDEMPGFHNGISPVNGYYAMASQPVEVSNYRKAATIVPIN